MAVPGSGTGSGTGTFSTQATTAGPSIAPLLAQGAIMALAARPVMKGARKTVRWTVSALNGRSPGKVPHDPNGADQPIPTRRPTPKTGQVCPHRGFASRTCGSSRKTRRSGGADTAGMRCLNPSSRCRSTLARRRSAATGLRRGFDPPDHPLILLRHFCRSRSDAQARRSRHARQTPAPAS